MVLEIHLCDAMLELGAENSIADPEESKVGELAAKGWRGGQEIVVAFEMEQAGDGADSDVFGVKAELSARCFARDGRR